MAAEAERKRKLHPSAYTIAEEALATAAAVADQDRPSAEDEVEAIEAAAVAAAKGELPREALESPTSSTTTSQAPPPVGLLRRGSTYLWKATMAFDSAEDTLILGENISNRSTILTDIDRLLGRTKPPAIEFLFVGTRSFFCNIISCNDVLHCKYRGCSSVKK
jgi:hypothetical protein